MTPTGIRLPTDHRAPARMTNSGRSLGAPAVVASCLALVVLLSAGGAWALDVFTLWRQPEAPLRIEVGSRVDYQGTSIETGRRRTEALRIQCVDRTDAAWLIEILPLEWLDGTPVPMPGRGLRLTVDQRLADRSGNLIDHVLKVEQWDDGVHTELPPEQWRDDPLASAFLDSGFVPDTTEAQGSTTRVVDEIDLLCAQFTLTAGDTTHIALPHGEMIQIHTREVSVAVHADVPFLGLAYAAERAETRSELVPAGRRSPPPPSMTVEIMELIDFGEDAVSAFVGLE